ncbi:hypothetical protein A9Q81_26985 [Gammaproteobacteria bacterium 42_54_T18]|nr:hypothetical protein A9Q81_26985 [Gammaproteobacteria bacterium 42_54_T18]
MSNKYIIFVDDSVSMQRIVESVLVNDYEVLCASGAKEVLSAMDQRVPDLFLLDIEMPEVDGYELAGMIRERDDGKQVPIVFLSSMNTEKVIVKSYEAGGTDFITKPIVGDELKAKLSIAIATSCKNIKVRLRDPNVDNTATSVALDAMRNAADLGQLLEFIQGTYTCKNFDALGHRLLDILAAYGLAAVVEIRTPKKKYQYSHNDTIQPLEQNIIDRFREEKRIMDFNNRTLINYSDVSLLIKNMPIDDDNRYGQLKDVLATLAQASEPMILSLFLKKQMNSQRLKLLTMAEMTQVSLDRLVGLHKQNKFEYVKFQESSAEDAKDLFHFLELSEHQENSITDLFLKNHKECEVRHEKNDEVDEELTLIIRALKETLGLISI